VNWADRCSSFLSYIRGRRVRQNCMRVNTTPPPPTPHVSQYPFPVSCLCIGQCRPWFVKVGGKIYDILLLLLSLLSISQVPPPFPNHAIPFTFSSSYNFSPHLFPHSYKLYCILILRLHNVSQSLFMVIYRNSYLSELKKHHVQNILCQKFRTTFSPSKSATSANSIPNPTTNE
jgi:hypothetical protein